MITTEKLQKLFPSRTAAHLAQFVDPLNKTFDMFEINNTHRQAMFLAQVGHESGELSAMVENLNYRPERLTAVFPRYFPTAASAQGMTPEKIANTIYANRMGNGNAASGDGWKFRGRGLIQLTGRENYTKFSQYMCHIDVDATIKYLETIEGATVSAGWFWNTRKLNPLADVGDVLSVTKIINGGTNGLPHRTELYMRASAALA